MRLSPHFTTEEFECKCGCGFGSRANDVSEELIEALEIIRGRVGPLIITSGCRCRDHNKKIGGSSNSAHMRGLAADIACNDSKAAYRLVENAIVYAGIERIGIERGCIHVDVDMSLPHPVLFGWDRTKHQS